MSRSSPPYRPSSEGEKEFSSMAVLAPSNAQTGTHAHALDPSSPAGVELRDAKRFGP